MFKKLFDSGYKELKKAKPVADKIDALASEMESLTDRKSVV